MHNVPQRKDTDLLSCFGTPDQNAPLCSAGTQTKEPVVSVTVQTDQVNRPSQCIAIQHPVLKKRNIQTDNLSTSVHNIQTDDTVKVNASSDCLHPNTCSTSIPTEEQLGIDKA